MSSPDVSAADDGKKAEASRVLAEILGHMGVKAALDVKDGADGGISIAMTVEGHAPGLTAGKRSQVVDSLQFLINKIINKTPQSRRYITLGVGEHAPPRQPNKPAAAPASPPKQQPVAQPPKSPPPQRPPRHKQVDEASLEVEEDPALTVAARELAEKAAKHGRFIGLINVSPEDRARMMKAMKDVPGVQLRLEGEGRNRRLSLHPDKPAPMPKSMLPDYDDEEEDDDEQE